MSTENTETYTKNFKLTKPGLDDNYDIRKINDNMDKVDDICFGNVVYEETSDAEIVSRKLTIEGITSYDEIIGKLLFIKSNTDGGTSGNININELGTKQIRRPQSGSAGFHTALQLYWVSKGQVYCVQYDGTYFNLLYLNTPQVATTAEATACTNIYKMMVPVRVADVTGKIASLTTTDKTNLVAAINELNTRLKTLEDNALTFVKTGEY